MSVTPGTVVRIDTCAYVVAWMTAMWDHDEPPPQPAEGYASAGPWRIVGVCADGIVGVQPVVQAGEA